MSRGSDREVTSFDAMLLDVAEHWCRETRRLSVDYVQAFVEATSDVRLDSRLGHRVAVDAGSSMTRRYGVGLLLHHGRTWKYAHAPLHQPEQLVERLEQLRVGTPKLPARWCAVSPLETDSGDASWATALIDLVPQDTEVLLIRDFYQQYRAVVDSAGTRRSQVVLGGRQRAIVTMRDGCQVAQTNTRASDRRWRATGDADAQIASAVGQVQAALTLARHQLRSRPMGERTTPVVFAPKVGAALLHELVGHALEADNAARQTARGSSLMGARLTSEPLFLDDDPLLADGIGSRQIDDDGQACRPTPLVENGVVVGQLTTMRTEGVPGVDEGLRPSTGGWSGRRENYRHASLPRAFNTVVRPGRESAQALLAPSPDGLLYVQSLGGGNFDPNRGVFSFSAEASAYLTPAGDLQPLTDVYLFGEVRPAMERLAGIADDVDGDNVTCRKQGQSLHIGLYSPTMLFDQLTWRC